MYSLNLKDNEVRVRAVDLHFNQGMKQKEVATLLSVRTNTLSDFLSRKTWGDWWASEGVGLLRGESYTGTSYYGKGPKMLSLDIETAPILGSVWGLWQQNVGLSMINADWYILSWSAKWFGEPEVLYEDKRDSWDDNDDSTLLKGIWKLLDEADIIITQNGKKFDAKKLNARFILNGMTPPSSYKHVDTLQIAKRHFGFTSNKLEYMTDKLCKVYKKLKHGQFPGFELWKQCLLGNMEAWDEMKEYNIHDVLSLEELYVTLRPWMNTHPNINVYYEDLEVRCSCGSQALEHNGYAYSNLSKFDRFQCTDCGSEVRGRVNLLPKDKRQSLMMNVGS